MNRIFLLAMGCASAIGLGCGPSVEEVGAASTSVGSGGSSMASSSAGSGGGFTAASSSGSGSATCDGVDLFFDVTGDGPLQHYDASCLPAGNLNCGGPGGVSGQPSDPTPPPPPGGALLDLRVCEVKSPFWMQALMASLPGSSINIQNTMYWSSMNNAAYTTVSGGSVMLMSFGAVGQPIEGSYTITVAHDPGQPGPAQLSLAGNFRVCRLQDICFP